MVGHRSRRPGMDERMTPNDLDDKDSIARELGWESFDAAPHPVQCQIEAGRDADTEDPMAFLRRGE